MNAKIVMTLALALPLSAQAQSQSPIPDIDPVHAVVQKSVVKDCYHNAFSFLERRDVAQGLGLPWVPEMNQLRKDANRRAAQVCHEEWPAVKFTFLRGKRPADMAIVIGNPRDRLAGTP